MKLRGFVRSLTPCSLVLAIFPVWFLLFPEGIPFVYADCGGGLSSHVSNMQGASSTPKYNDTTPAATVQSYTLDNSSNACEFKVSVTFTIFAPPAGGQACDASRFRICHSPTGQNCQPTGEVFANGAGSHTLSNYTNQCNESGDNHEIVVQLANCILVGGGTLFSASASSSVCDI